MAPVVEYQRKLVEAQAGPFVGAEGDVSAVWCASRGSLAVAGDFTGITSVTLEMSPDNGVTWIPVGANVQFTQMGVGNFELGHCLLRINIDGAGGSISAWLDNYTP